MSPDHYSERLLVVDVVSELVVNEQSVRVVMSVYRKFMYGRNRKGASMSVTRPQDQTKNEVATLLYGLR